MDWKGLGEAVAKLGLPLLGAALPIPGGAAIGTALASAIGAPSASPDDILTALTANAQAVQAAKQFELQHQEKMLELTLQNDALLRQADSTDLSAVNVTMQTEARAAASEDWFTRSWRPFCGYVVGVASMVTVSGVLWLAYEALTGKDAGALNAIPPIVTSVAMILGIPGAAVGITAWHRGVQDRNAASSGS